ncbi:MAG TPA: DUF3035 domain-containing protein [Parvibaculum sp.]
MSKSRRIVALSVLGALSLSLAACGGDSIRDALGYGKDAPDEFAVMTKAPLVIPPDFSLRPPQPGAPRPQEANFQPSIAAERSMTGVNAAPVAGVETEAVKSPGEQALLEQTGGNDADPHIRQVVNSETRTLVEKDASFTDDILFWREKTPPDLSLVDPAAEKKRLQENEAQGKPTTEGQTPSHTPKPGWFDGIF